MASRWDVLKQSVSGNVDKAYLLVRKEIRAEEDNKNGALTSISKLSSLADKLEAGVSQISSGASLLGINTGISSIAVKEGYVPIKVQYNPASIQFSGIRNGQEVSRDGTFPDYDRPSETSMHMELIFDTMENGKAFMLDKTAKDTVDALFSSSLSARHIVELLIGATIFNSTRWVGFAWGKMSFWGELTAVDATYTMFDTDGEPVRAKVGITIREDAVNITNYKPGESNTEMKENRVSEQKQWDKQFIALGKKKPMMSSSVSNLLNTNL